MSYGMKSGALSRGRTPRARTIIGLAIIAAATFAMTIGTGSASAAFTANGFSLGASTTQAGGHPAVTLSASNDPVAADLNGDDLKSLQFELPAGMLLNPRAVSTPCPTATFATDGCAASTQVGTISVTFRVAGKLYTAPGQVYSITPDANSLINFGFIVRPTATFQKFSFTSGAVTGLGAVRPSPDADLGLTIPIPALPRTIKTNVPQTASMTIANISITFNPRSGTATSGLTFTSFTHAPTRCTPASSKVSFTSYANVTATRTSSYTPSGCDQLKFDLMFVVSVPNTRSGSATGFSATTYIPDADQDLAIQPAQLKDLSINLPTGTSINPSTTVVLPQCSDTDLAADTCPTGSKVGNVSLAVPFLAAGLTGDMYLTSLDGGVQLAFVLRGERGVRVILRGSMNVVTSSSGASGVVVKFQPLPQVPWTSFTVNLNSRFINNPKNQCPNASGWADIRSYAGNRWLYGFPYPQTGCAVDTTITSTTPALINTRTPKFTFTSAPAGASFECSVDNAAFSGCTSEFTTTSLADGDHTFAVRASLQGVTDTTPAQVSFKVDATPPTFGLTFPVNDDVFNTGTITPVYTAETGATGMCAIDTGAGTPCPSGALFSGIPAGTHKIYFYARDAAGNISTRVPRTIKIASVTGPKVKITAPVTGSNLLTDQLIPEFTATSPIGTAIASTQCRVFALQFKPSINTYLESQLDNTPCTSGSPFAKYEPGKLYRLKIVATDATGDVGIDAVDFIASKPAPAAPEVVNDVNQGSLSDRTPTFDLNYYDQATWADPDIDCAIAKKGEAPVWSHCGTGSNLPDFTPAQPLTDGEWKFYARSVAGAVVGDPLIMGFTVGNWTAVYTASTTTQKAGAHPDLDVDITPTGAGQFRTVDLTLPKGLIGSLNSFPKCADVVHAICHESTKVGSVMVDYGIASQNGLVPTPGDVYLTGPQGPNDVAGMVINVFGPVDPFADTIIPLHIELVNNAQEMHVYSDSIPTAVGDIYDPTKFTNFWVYDFKMHIDGSKGSPFPLLTNSSRCVPAQFSGSFGDTEGTKTPKSSIAYQPTDCASLPFEPNLTQTFSNTTATAQGSVTGINAGLTLPAENSTIRRITVKEPSVFGPNFPSFGSSGDRCKPSAIVDNDPTPAVNYVFNYSAANCPASARVGTLRIVSPLLTAPLNGDVYLVDAGSLPRFGVKVDQDGISLRLAGVNTIIRDGCDETIFDLGCPDQVQVDFDSIPDLPLSSFDLNLDETSRTNNAGTGQLSSRLLNLQPSFDTYNCRPSVTAETTITSWSGATKALQQTVQISGCDTP